MPKITSPTLSNPVMDDLFLWEQVRNSDKSGMEGLYVKYTQELFRLGMSIKPDRSFVKDCIHEIFLNIWQYRLSLKATDNVKLYLFKCLSHTIHKEIGKDKRRYGQENIEQFEDFFQVDDVESETVLDQLNFGKKTGLMLAMSQLPLRQKEVIQYLFFENQTYEDISKIMGINVQSAYTLAWKAIANLRKNIVYTFFLLSLL